MLEFQDFENNAVYREYVLKEFNMYWQKFSADDWYRILTEVLYNDDLAQVVRACEEY